MLFFPRLARKKNESDHFNCREVWKDDNYDIGENFQTLTKENKGLEKKEEKFSKMLKDQWEKKK